MDLSILSNIPPDHGAFSILIDQCILISLKYCLTSEWFIIASLVLAADLKVFPLSEMNLCENPLLTVKCLTLLRNVSAVISYQSWCTAITIQQLYKQIHTLLFVRELLYKCVMCHKFDGGPYQSPLPLCLISESKPNYHSHQHEWILRDCYMSRQQRC